MVSEEKEMEILELVDLLGSIPQAARMANVDPKTVRRIVAARALGVEPDGGLPRETLADSYLDQIDGWIDKSTGNIRADVVHAKLAAMGYQGAERTTRRIVAARKTLWRTSTHRTYKPWITEPGLWLQYDFGDGPVVADRPTVLFCAWLAWSRFRVVIPLVDKTLPSVIAALDATFRRIGGAPTYVLTDNEKTVTTRHIAGIAVRNPAMVSAARYYGVTIATCVPYDPESKGGSERTVAIAKADLVPTEENLAEEYASFVDLEAACAEATDRFNAREHSVTCRTPVSMVADERPQLHGVAASPYSAAFGETRSVSWSSCVSFRRARYSVPDTHVATTVWVRASATEVVIMAGGPDHVTEIARHPLLGPGGASILDAHYRGRPSDPLNRRPKATNDSESAFLSIGAGAELFLTEAAASGAAKIEQRMAEAVRLASVHGTDAVDRALGAAALAGRFETGAVASILTHGTRELLQGTLAPESHSLASGTSMWAGLGEGRGTDDPVAS
jgi:transposase